VCNIYAPGEADANFDSDGWKTANSEEFTVKELSFSRVLANFAASNPDTPTAKGRGLLSAVSLALGLGDSVAKTAQNIPVKVITQEKDGDNRTIIQVGADLDFYKKNADKVVYSEDTRYRLTLDKRHADDK
jgi:hypothetical protein